MRAPGEQVGADGHERDGAVEGPRLVRERPRERRRPSARRSCRGAHVGLRAIREQRLRAAVGVEERRVRLRPRDPLLPEGGGGRRVGVRALVGLEELAVVAVGRVRRGRVRAPRRLDDGVDGEAGVRRALRRGAEGALREDPLDGDDRPAPRPSRAPSPSRRASGRRGRSRASSAASRVDDRDVDGERGALDVGRARRLVDLLARRLRVEGEHVGAEPGLRRDERQAVARRLQPADQRVLAVLLDLDLAGLDRGAEAGRQAEALERDESGDRPCGRNPRRRAIRSACRGRSPRASGRAPSGARAHARTPSGPRSSRARRARSWRRRRPPRPPPPASGACSRNRRIRC